MHKRLLCSLLLALGFLPLRAQDDAFVFSHLKESDGLSDNVINYIFKDSCNMIWIGTYNGFNRFDGANFYSYKIRKGDNSMINEVIHSMCEDRTGKIWCATNNGVFSYDPVQDRYTNYEIRSLGKNRNFYNVYCDRRGTVWAAGTWSLFRFNAQAGNFEEKLRTVDPKDTSRYFLITKNGLMEDPELDRFWITTASGLWYYDTETGKAGNAVTQPANPLFRERNCAAIHRSANGNSWFFDNNQKAIIQFDPATLKELQQIYIGTLAPQFSGATIFEDKSKRLWISSWNYEMLVVDRNQQNRIQRLNHRADDNRSIAGNFFWTAYQDANNTIWFGTVAGISRCNPERNLYKEYRLASQVPQMKDQAIHLVEEDPADKTFWLITKASQLIHYNPANGSYEIFDLNAAVKNKAGELPGYCSMIRFLDNKVVITTSTGAWQLSKGSKRLVLFTGMPKGAEDFTCRELAADGDSVLYFNDGRQLLYWNRRSDQTRYIGFADPKPTGQLYGLKIGPNHRTWMMITGNQLVELNNDRLQVRSLNRDFKKDAGVLISVLPDANNNLWVLNRGTGIYHYNTSTQQTMLLNATDGLAGNRVHNIVQDKSGRIWSMLYDKVSVYIPAANKFYNFRIPYSESDLGYVNHLTHLSNDHIAGTVNDELVEFYPERLLAVPVMQKPQVSQLSVSGATYQIFGNERIRLNADQNTVRIRFGSLISKDIFPYDLEYRLEGAESNWTAAGEHAEALYNNLAPGSYTFRVRAIGKNNSWQSEEAVLRFSIRVPFYRSYWFIAAVLLLLALGIYLLYRYRIGQREKLLVLEGKAQMLEKEKALVMYENLKQHLNPHFLFNSLTSLSSLIRLDQNMAGDFLDKMSKVYRYILKNRDNEVVPISDELRFVQLYIDLQKTRFGKGLQVEIRLDEELHHRRIAPVTLQNLVENAIKHNTSDEDSPLVIEIFEADDYLVVRNNLQKKKFVETSNRQGLANMESLYQFLSRRPMEITEDNNYFTVKIPLL